MKNYITGGEVLEYTVPSATTITAGDPVLIGDLLGVAVNSGVTGDVIAVNLEGVYTLPKNTGAGTAIGQGSKAYFDASAKKVTGTDNSGANKHIGWGYAASVTADATAQIKLLTS